MAYGVSIDPETRKVYVVGQMELRFDTSTRQWRDDAFLASYDHVGAQQYIHRFGSPNQDAAHSVAVNTRTGEVYLVGHTGGSIDDNLYAGETDIFLAKYDAFGVKQWIRQFGQDKTEYAYGIDVDPETGSLYVSGGTYGRLDSVVSRNDSDAFLVKYDSYGTILWIDYFSGKGIFGGDMGYDVTVDPLRGSVYVTGDTDLSSSYQDNHEGILFWVHQENRLAQPSFSPLFTVNPTDIALSWSAVDGAVQYHIDRCEGTGCTNYTRVATVSGTTYTDQGLSPNTFYNYRVQASGSNGRLGIFSEALTVYTPREQQPIDNLGDFIPNYIKAPSASDTRFVTTQGGDLDQYRNRDEGVIRFNIEVTRAITDGSNLFPDGRLRNPNALIQQGVVSSTAQLKIAVFDVDSTLPPGVSSSVKPELDQVFLVVNGSRVPLQNMTFGVNCPVGKENCLGGSNGQWTVNTFEVPIGLIRFPNPCNFRRPEITCQPDPAGFLTPIPQENTIEIHIDQDNQRPIWRVAVDWASLSFQAMSPAIFIHGTNGLAEQGNAFFTAFNNVNLLFDHSIQLPGWVPKEGRFDSAESFNCSAKRLAGYMRTADMARREAALGCYNTVTTTSIPAIAKRFGVHGVHLVTHSKGGMDARGYIARYAQKGEILSLITIGTPHKGSVLADLAVAAWDASYVELVHKECPPLVSIFSSCAMEFKTRLERELGNMSDGIRDLIVRSASQFNRENSNSLVEHRPIQYGAISADADRNGDGYLTDGELGDVSGSEDSLARGYRFVGENQAVEIQTQEYCITSICSKQIVRILGIEVGELKIGGWREGPVGVSIPSPFFQPNDGVVSVESAQGFKIARTLKYYRGPEGQNHMTLLQSVVADSTIIPHLKDVEKTHGDFR